MRKSACLLILLAAVPLHAADYPAPTEGEHVLRDFRFTSGEVLPELRIHYRTLGEPRRDDRGVVRNAVLVLHGTTGSGANFLRPEFAGELFGEGQPLDAGRFYLILPDAIGHGGSSKPSDGLRARFPRYGYRDMVAAQHRLLTEGLKDHLGLAIGQPAKPRMIREEPSHSRRASGILFSEGRTDQQSSRGSLFPPVGVVRWSPPFIE